MKTLPNNPQIERYVLGTLILYPESLEKVSDILRPELFHDKKHRTIFETILFLAQVNEPIDLVSVYDELRKSELGIDAPFLSGLTNSISSPQNIVYHSRALYEKAVLRKLIITAESIIRDAEEENDDTLDLVEVAREKLGEILDEITQDGDYNLVEKLDEVFDDIKERANSLDDNSRFLQSRYLPSINKITGGFMNGDLITIAGKDKHGKSTMAETLTIDFAINQKAAVGIFSLEMNIDVLVWKAISLECEVEYIKLRNPKGLADGTGKLTDKDIDEIHQRAVRRFNQTKIFLIDRVLNERQIKSKMKKMIKKHKIRWFVIDYIGLIPSTGKHDNREREIAYLTRFFKNAAKELKVPICILSQKNRAGEQAESLGANRDSDFVFGIMKPLEEGVKTVEGTLMTENDYLITVERSRHGLQGRQFLVSYFGTKFREKDSEREEPIPQAIDDELPF